MILTPVARGMLPRPASFLAAVLFLAGGLMARGRWWLFKSSRTEIDEALSATCRMALARLAVLPDGYEIHTSRESLTLSLSQRGPALEVGFRGPWRTGKKGVLIRKLIAKQFDPVMPRLRIRLRRVR